MLTSKVGEGAKVDAESHLKMLANSWSRTLERSKVTLPISKHCGL
jgi:hypothetical protein